MIAIARLALAISCLLALWWDAGGPAAMPMASHAVMLAYGACAGMLVVVTWDDWWREYALSNRVVALDMIFYGALVFLEPAGGAPSFALFIFIMLSGLQQRRFRTVELTAALCILVFVLMRGAALSLVEPQVDREGFQMQVANRIILALLFVWFAGRRDGRAPVEDGWSAGRPEDRSAPAMLLRQAAAQTGSDDLVMLTMQAGGQRVAAWALRNGQFSALPCVAGRTLPAALAGKVALVDVSHDRALIHDPVGERILPMQGILDDASMLASLAPGLDKALVLSVQGRRTRALIFARGVAGLCSGDLVHAVRMADHLSAWLDRSDAEQMVAARARQEVRLSLARDIHDSVAQSLAGTALRLQALKRQYAVDAPLRGELESLIDDLQQERREVRVMITRLRDGLDPEDAAESGGGEMGQEKLAQLCARLSHQWRVPCDLRVEGEDNLPPALSHDVRQIIREAMSNAVRHGRATRIHVRLRADARRLDLKIESDGFALPPSALSHSAVQPWTVYTRVRDRGGFVHFTSDAGRSVIDINLPMEAAA